MRTSTFGVFFVAALVGFTTAVPTVNEPRVSPLSHRQQHHTTNPPLQSNAARLYCKTTALLSSCQSDCSCEGEVDSKPDCSRPECESPHCSCIAPAAPPSYNPPSYKDATSKGKTSGSKSSGGSSSKGKSKSSSSKGKSHKMKVREVEEGEEDWE
jgi:hypothetical protein